MHLTMWRAASAMARGVRGSSGWVSTARWSHAGAETSDAAEAAVEEVEIVEVPQALPADFVRAVLSRLLTENRPHGAAAAMGTAAGADADDEGASAIETEEDPYYNIRGGYAVDCLDTKATLLYECMVEFGKDVPSFRLNSLKTVDDIVTYFEEPVLEYGKREGEKPDLYDLQQNQTDYPKNLRVRFRGDGWD